MDVKELRGLTDDELREKEALLSQEQFNLRFQISTGRLENTMQIRKNRRDLARVKTVRREAQLAAGKTTSKGKG